MHWNYLLFEKLVGDGKQIETLSSKAYDIVDALPEQDQELILTILNCILSFRNR